MQWQVSGKLACTQFLQVSLLFNYMVTVELTVITQQYGEGPLEPACRVWILAQPLSTYVTLGPITQLLWSWFPTYQGGGASAHCFWGIWEAVMPL